MPLNNKSKQVGLGAFINQQPSDRYQNEPLTHGTISRQNETQPRRDSDASNGSSDSNPMRAKDIFPVQNERLVKARQLKLKVRDTAVDRLDIRTSTTAAGHGRNLEQDQVNGRFPGHQSNSQPVQISTFDDTVVSLDFNEDSSFQNNEDQTTVFRGIQPQAREKINHETRQYKQNGALPTGSNGIDIDQNQRSEFTEKRDEQQNGSFRDQYGSASTKGFQHIGRSDQNADQYVRTPSRAQAFLPIIGGQIRPVNKAVAFDSPSSKHQSRARDDSPELEIPRNNVAQRATSKLDGIKDRYTSNTGRGPESLHIKDDRPSAFSSSSNFGQHTTIQTSQQQPPIGSFEPSRGSFEPSRASDYPTSSEEEIPSKKTNHTTNFGADVGPQQSRKRQRAEDIDYDVTTLRTMSYEDLHKENFDADPKTSGGKVTLASQGNQSSLSELLSNLGKLNGDEQRSIFHSQHDDEWSQTGLWFINQFQEGLEKLMQTRIERRKISMRFEDEIRRRQRDIERSASSLENELRSLKKGGGDLIKGRDAPSRRGTPQK